MKFSNAKISTKFNITGHIDSDIEVGCEQDIIDIYENEFKDDGFIMGEFGEIYIIVHKHISLNVGDQVYLGAKNLPICEITNKCMDFVTNMVEYEIIGL